ncbi:hypothetical protein BTVI_82469 [Pitangus sulphuratus]|nr:hypothetical protein BTVI_82469 [Pitangus sulphuratus]
MDTGILAQAFAHCLQRPCQMKKGLCERQRFVLPVQLDAAFCSIHLAQQETVIAISYSQATSVQPDESEEYFRCAALSLAASFAELSEICEYFTRRLHSLDTNHAGPHSIDSELLTSDSFKSLLQRVLIGDWKTSKTGSSEIDNRSKEDQTRSYYKAQRLLEERFTKHSSLEIMDNYDNCQHCSPVADDEHVENLWVRTEGQASEGDTLGIYYRPPNQEKEVDEAFYRQFEAASKSQAVVLVGDFSYPDICWRSTTVKDNHSTRFLESVDDNFLRQDPPRNGVLLDLMLTEKEGFVGDVKTGGHLGCSDYEICEFSFRGGEVGQQVWHQHSDNLAVDEVTGQSHSMSTRGMLLI